MNINKPASRNEAGAVLFNAIVFSGVLGIGSVALLSLGNNRVRSAFNRWDSNEAYYHAENALTWAAQRIADNSSGLVGNYSYSGGNVTLGYLTGLSDSSTTALTSTVIVWATRSKTSNSSAIRKYIVGVPNSSLGGRGTIGSTS